MVMSTTEFSLTGGILRAGRVAELLELGHGAVDLLAAPRRVLLEEGQRGVDGGRAAERRHEDLELVRRVPKAAGEERARRPRVLRRSQPLDLAGDRPLSRDVGL